MDILNATQSRAYSLWPVSWIQYPTFSLPYVNSNYCSTAELSFPTTNLSQTELRPITSGLHCPSRHCSQISRQTWQVGSQLGENGSSMEPSTRVTPWMPFSLCSGLQFRDRWYRDKSQSIILRCMETLSALKNLFRFLPHKAIMDAPRRLVTPSSHGIRTHGRQSSEPMMRRAYCIVNDMSIQNIASMGLSSNSN